MVVGVQRPESPGALPFEASEAEGVRVFSVTGRIVITIDAGISKFGYLVAMRIEMEANSRLEIMVLHSTMI